MADKRIGRRIQACREKRGYTQDQFSEMIGVTPNFLSAIERGVKYPSMENLIKIIETLDISSDEIFIDVIKSGYKIRASKIADEMDNLSAEERSRIFAVLETLVKEAKK
ncbi:MAG: helix-turn-helix transcriptional regulator [Oscillospiraceae bacterium]|nr:helix-turn-helix transcriptional regulator [Oscillospiraceae bacterium]